MTFSASTNRYAYSQGFDASSLQHRRPLLVVTWWHRMQRHRASAAPASTRS